MRKWPKRYTEINLFERLDGWKFARAVCEAEPSFSIVYMSGSHAQERGARGVPRKPFAPAQVAIGRSRLLNTVPLSERVTDCESRCVQK